MIKKIFVLLLLGMTITFTWILFETYSEKGAPALSVGDQWTYKWVGQGLVPVTEIIGRKEDFEGTKCYVRIRDLPGPEFPGAQSIWMTFDWIVLKTCEEDLDNLANIDDLPLGSEVAYITKYFPGWKLIDFPLTVGNEWGARSHFSVSNVDIEGEIMYTGYDAIDWVRKVVSIETITVPAGTFNTYVIEEIKFGDKTRYWFSLDAKNYVKIENLGKNNDVNLTIILTSYKLENNLPLFIALSASIGFLGIIFFIYSGRHLDI